MTAGPHQFDRKAPAWFVATDQGVVLGGPYADELSARAGGNVVADRLRADMRRERYSERKIAERVAALRVGYGIRIMPHGLFELTSP